MDPTHCIIPVLDLNPSAAVFRFSPHGSLMKIFCNVEMMALHVSCTITHTVHRATPNKCAIVLYSKHVARHHRVIANHLLTGVALQSWVFLRCSTGPSFDISSEKSPDLVFKII